MKIKLDNKTILFVKLSDDKNKIILSTQIENLNGNIFLNTVALSEDVLTDLITELITLKSKLQ
jgi:hypothetical protein